MCAGDHDECGHDVGRLINTLSLQLKRQMCAHESEDSLTNMQRHVLHIFCSSLCSMTLPERPGKGVSDPTLNSKRNASASGEKRIHPQGKRWRRDARLKKIVPTDKARGVREHILGNIRYMESTLRRGIPEEKLKVCMEVLEQMSANLTENEKAPGQPAADLQGNESINRKKEEEKTDHE